MKHAVPKLNLLQPQRSELINDFQVSSLISQINSQEENLSLRQSAHQTKATNRTSSSNTNRTATVRLSSRNKLQSIASKTERSSIPSLSTNRSVRLIEPSLTERSTRSTLLVEADKQEDLILTQCSDIAQLIDEDTARSSTLSTHLPHLPTRHPETSRPTTTTVGTARSKTSNKRISTSRSVTSIQPALYTARSTTSSVSSLHNKHRNNYNKNNNNSRNNKSGKYRPWNQKGLSKKGVLGVHNQKLLKDIDVAAEIKRTLQKDVLSWRSSAETEHGVNPAMSIVDRETMADQFNEMFEESLIEMAARVQLDRGGRHVTQLGVYNTLRGPAALCLRAKGDVATRIEAPAFTQLGKTLGSLTKKMSNSAMSGMTTTTGDAGTEGAKQHDFNRVNKILFKNVPSTIVKYLDTTIRHQHDLRGVSLLMPKNPAFIEMQSAQEIKHRQDRAEKFSLVRELRDNYAKNVNSTMVKERENSHVAMRTRRETREQTMGKSPSGCRVGGGFTTPYGSRAQLDATAKRRTEALQKKEAKQKLDRANKWRESRKKR